MKTEKDIRKFIQDNRIKVPSDGAFMEDLVRQINLLPVPAGLSGDDDRLQENMRLVQLIRAALRKRYRRRAVLVLLTDIAICVALFLAAHFTFSPEAASASDVLAFVYTWRYLLLGITSLAVLGFSLRQLQCQ